MMNHLSTLSRDERAKHIAAELQATLGQRLVAYATRQTNPRTVGEWADGLPVDEVSLGKLERLYAVTQTLLRAGDAEVARAWLIGANPHLLDEAPIEAMHQGQSETVHTAARRFARASNGFDPGF